MPPPLVLYATVAEYRQHYVQKYCENKHYTFDGLRVFFPVMQFEDAFFESAHRRARDKSIFSRGRAERIDWISKALMDSTAELYAGWDRDKKQINASRRVTLIYGDYVIVLSVFLNKKRCTFITAYVADSVTIGKIRTGPKWGGLSAV